jgi:hypothetical protein
MTATMTPPRADVVCAYHVAIPLPTDLALAICAEMIDQLVRPYIVEQLDALLLSTINGRRLDALAESIRDLGERVARALEPNR